MPPQPRVHHPYRDRSITFTGVRQVAGYQLKLYEITVDGTRPHAASFNKALDLAAARLPQPPITENRFGLGFVIFHRGRGEDYLVLCWWDQENEIFSRVWITKNDDANGWYLATKGNVACVWDLQVIWFEREAFVKTILAREGPPDVAGYLREALNVMV